jgi:hypothetical protein
MLRMRRASVVWKKEGGRVLIMSKKGIFQLNQEAAKIWESLDESNVPAEDADPFIKSLLDAKLVEVYDE